jgi:uncharacterized membrane protein
MRPLAAGALSIGLVLVFIGSVVPRPTDTSPSRPAVVREGDGLVASSPSVEALTRAAAPTTVAQKLGEPPASEREPADTLGGQDPGTLEMSAPGEELESQDTAGLADAAAEAAAEAAPPEAAARSDRGTNGAPLASGAPADGSFADMRAATLAEDDAAPADTAARTEVDAPDDDEVSVLAADAASVETAPASNDAVLGTILVTSGIALVAIGLLLTFVLVASRRHRDAAGF